MVARELVVMTRRRTNRSPCTGGRKVTVRLSAAEYAWLVDRLGGDARGIAELMRAAVLPDVPL